MQVVGDGFVAFTALPLAVRANGEIFANDFWRGALAVTGAVFSFIFIRALFRLLQGYRPRLDEQGRRRLKLKGKLFALLGLWLLALAFVPALGSEAIALPLWHKIGYGITGALNLLVGVVSQSDPARHLQMQRVRSGEGVRGRARILRANDTGAIVNDMPQVRIDFSIEVEGRDPYETTDKIVMQQSKLALLIPGSTVGVTVDQVNPHVFHLDWDDWQGPSG